MVANHPYASVALVVVASIVVGLFTWWDQHHNEPRRREIDRLTAEYAELKERARARLWAEEIAKAMSEARQDA